MSDEHILNRSQAKLRLSDLPTKKEDGAEFFNPTKQAQQESPKKMK
jgi:hypothetical protein